MNDTGQRAFFCSMMTVGNSSACKIVRMVDSVLRPHGLPTFHRDPQPHLSLAWVLAGPDRKCQSFDDVLHKISAPGLCSVKIDSVCCLVGQKRHILWAPSER
mmetsp:Transcript_18930/g.57183  ORF Transcript_18930/g.57183 Transcript_18930/m.57183 type:complete len:102 (-) Transcript_18930:1469-1774(-)